MSALDEAIEPRTLRGEAVRRIRAAIIYGEIEPGRIHSAIALAERLGVSITPVREALLELANRGMVTQVRNRGFRVVEHTPEDLDAALEVRALLEVPMLRRVAGTLAAGEFRDLVDDGVAAARAGDMPAFLDLDRRFHLGLLERAGNPRVVGVIDGVLDHLRFAAYAPREGAPSLVAVAEGHAAILDALAAGDPDAVEREVTAHLDLTRSAWR